MKGDAYKLARPSTPEQWQGYHDMRRKILWENKGTTLMIVSASADAVEFYRKCGYWELDEIEQSRLTGNMNMAKLLTST